MPAWTSSPWERTNGRPSPILVAPHTMTPGHRLTILRAAPGRPSAPKGQPRGSASSVRRAAAARASSEGGPSGRGWRCEFRDRAVGRPTDDTPRTVKSGTPTSAARPRSGQRSPRVRTNVAANYPAGTPREPVRGPWETRQLHASASKVHLHTCLPVDAKSVSRDQGAGSTGIPGSF
jgi:hypothetical protein